jgi:hypothetical protein
MLKVETFGGRTEMGGCGLGGEGEEGRVVNYKIFETPGVEDGGAFMKIAGVGGRREGSGG